MTRWKSLVYTSDGPGEKEERSLTAACVGACLSNSLILLSERLSLLYDMKNCVSLIFLLLSPVSFIRRDGRSHVQGRGWLFLPLVHREAALSPWGRRTGESGANAVRTWSLSPHPGGQNCPENWASVQMLPQLRKSGSFLKSNWIRSENSLYKDTVSKGSMLYTAFTFLSAELRHSVLSDFLELKHLLTFLGIHFMEEVQASPPQTSSVLDLAGVGVDNI